MNTFIQMVEQTGSAILLTALTLTYIKLKVGYVKKKNVISIFIVSLIAWPSKKTYMHTDILMNT